jgi:hypothetical protein
MIWSYTASPPCHLHGGDGTALLLLYFTFYTICEHVWALYFKLLYCKRQGARYLFGKPSFVYLSVM